MDEKKSKKFSRPPGYNADDEFVRDILEGLHTPEIDALTKKKDEEETPQPKDPMSMDGLSDRLFGSMFGVDPID